MTYPYRREDSPSPPEPPAPGAGVFRKRLIIGALAVVAGVAAALGLVHWGAEPVQPAARPPTPLLPRTVPTSSADSTPPEPSAPAEPSTSAAPPPPPTTVTRTVTPPPSPSATATHPSPEPVPPPPRTTPPTTADIVLEVSGGRGGRVARISWNDGTPSAGSHVYALPFSHTSTVALPKNVRITVEQVNDGPYFGRPSVLSCRILRGGSVLDEQQGQGYTSCSASLS